MDPLDWIRGELGEARDQIVLRPLRNPNAFWYDLMLPKAVLTAFWALQAADGSPAPGQQTTRPSDAWMRAHEAFGWQAFKDARKHSEFMEHLRASPDLWHDNALRPEIQKLSDACDRILDFVKAESCSGYTQVRGTLEITPLPSWIFTQGLTVNIFNGQIDRLHADPEFGREVYNLLKAEGRDGLVWFRRDELLAALNGHTSVRELDGSGRPGNRTTEPQKAQIAKEGPSLRSISRSVSHQPLAFAIDAANHCVVFGNGASLCGAAFRLVSKLYESYTEDLRARRASKDIRFVPAVQLAASLKVSEHSIRQTVARLRSNMKQQLARRGETLPACAVIESRGWRGYRLNPHLAVSATLIQPPPTA